MPEAVFEVEAVVTALEEDLGDMVDVEFTVENGTVWVLQRRSGKRSPGAAFRIARDLAEGGRITWTEALSRVTYGQFRKAQVDSIDAQDSPPCLTGIPASPGIAVGQAVFTSEAAVNSDGPVILVRQETSTDDYDGMMASVGVLTVTGGTTCHAAVVTRAAGRPCVVGATGLGITGQSYGKVSGSVVGEGDFITIDGSTGRVWLGAKKVIPGKLTESMRDVVSAAAGILKVRVRSRTAGFGSTLVPAAEYGTPEDLVEYLVKEERADALVLDLTPPESYTKKLPKSELVLAGLFPTDYSDQKWTFVTVVALCKEKEALAGLRITGVINEDTCKVLAEAGFVLEEQGPLWGTSSLAPDEVMYVACAGGK